MANRNPNPLVLNPDDEFEGVLVELVKTHRAKSKGYGDEDGDPYFNFYAGAEATSSTPLRQCEALLAKHSAALRQWFSRTKEADANPSSTRFSNDAYLDRAVYAIIALILYRRQKQ